MSNSLSSLRADIEKISASNPNQAAVDALKARINDKNTSDADRATANKELAARLEAA